MSITNSLGPIKINVPRITISDSKTLTINMSIELDNGDCLVITGPSGSGKTLTLKMLSGITPDIDRQSQIKCDGFSLKDFSDNEVPNSERLLICQYVPQDLSQFFIAPIVSSEIELSAEIMGLNIIEKAKARRNVLHFFNIISMSFFNVSTLSSGEEIFVAVCSALSRNPKILLLDEPFSNLSFENKTRLSERLREYCENGGILIIATHETGHIEKYIEENKLKTHMIPSQNPLTDIERPRLQGHSTDELYKLSGNDIFAEINSKFLFSHDDLIIRKGDCILLDGPNGSGKTSFLKYISGCNGKWPSNSTFAGQPVDTKEPNLPDDIGFVDQSPMTQVFDGVVKDFLCFTAKNSKNTKDEIDRSLSEFLRLLGKLNIIETDLITDLSYGQRKVLSISRYMNSPLLLIIDEAPISSDTYQQSVFLELLKILYSQGSTIIFTTHNSQKYHGFYNRKLEINSGWLKEGGV